MNDDRDGCERPPWGGPQLFRSLRRALELSASAAILIDTLLARSPSSANIELPRQIVEAGRALPNSIPDHLASAATGAASFRTLGLF